MKDRITIEGQGGAFSAYIARPKTAPAPAVVVLQELFGVNADIRKTCDELAENKASLRLRQTCSGGRSLASTLVLLPRLTGNTVFVSIKAMTETPARGMLTTRPTLWPNCLAAPARLLSSAIVSVR
jgi:hypothetical protein